MIKLADMYMTDGLHLSGKGAAVFADGLAVDSGMGSITNKKKLAGNIKMDIQIGKHCVGQC